MAYITKRSGKWLAEVCVNRRRTSKTFPTKKEALAWATEQEEDGILARHTLREALEEYRPIAESHRGWQAEVSRLGSLAASSLANLPLESITPARVASWRDARLKEVSPVSVRREMIILGAVFKVAISEWGWARVSPLDGVKKPQPGPARRRGISQEEIDAITENLRSMRSGPQVIQLFTLSLETGMRLSEMLSLRWEDVREKSVTLRATKNGDAREVPLSSVAREVIAARRGMDPDAVFTASTQVASKTFARASVNGVHLHDARSEAITRLSKKLDVLQLARMIGHRDLKSLMHYYAERADVIADRL